jgi:hypothetical protein
VVEVTLVGIFLSGQRPWITQGSGSTTKEDTYIKETKQRMVTGQQSTEDIWGKKT